MINTRDMFSGDGKDMPKGAFDRLAAVKNKDNPSEIMEALLDIKRDHEGILGQTSSYRYINMLSSPMTHTLNIVSNAATLGGEIGGRGYMKALDKMAPGESVLARGETRAGLAGAYAGVQDAAQPLLPQGRHVVLNFADRRSGLTVGDVEASIGVPVDAVVPRSKAIPLSTNKGLPLLADRSRDAAAKGLAKLAARVAGSGAARQAHRREVVA